jgi:hypothetical protein
MGVYMNGRGHTTHSLVITLFVIHDFVSFHNIRRYPQRTKDHLEMTDQLDAPDLITYLTGGPSELDVNHPITSDDNVIVMYILLVGIIRDETVQ